jgi:hypothetical protein
VETIRANVIGCLTLADVCLQKNIHMTYYGTGCIFHYDKDFPQGSGKGFMESDTPNFTGSYYSYTKVRAGSPSAPCLGGPGGPRPCSGQGGAPGPHARTLTLPPPHHHHHPAQAMVESLLKQYPNVLTLRVRMPIVADLVYPRNFITKIIKYDKVVDIPNSMTVLPELLPMSIEMVRR